MLLLWLCRSQGWFAIPQRPNNEVTLIPVMVAKGIKVANARMFQRLAASSITMQMVPITCMMINPSVRHRSLTRPEMTALLMISGLETNPGPGSRLEAMQELDADIAMCILNV